MKSRSIVWVALLLAFVGCQPAPAPVAVFPAEWSLAGKGRSERGAEGMVVSVHAYRNAWIWRFAQTSPAGVAGAPGNWSEPPPSLAQFLNEA